MAERVAVLGAGQMGNGIAHVFAQSGFDVTMIDVSPDALERGRATVASNLDRQIKKGTLQAADKNAIMERIKTASAMDATADASLVIEAVTENLLRSRPHRGTEGDPRQQHELHLDHGDRGAHQASAARHRHALHESGAGDAARRDH